MLSFLIGGIFGFILGYAIGYYISPVLKKRGFIIIYDEPSELTNILDRLNGARYERFESGSKFLDS